MTQTERCSPTVHHGRRRRPITDLALGSILSGGGSTPAENTPKAWADMVDRFQRRRSRRAWASRCSTASTPCTATATCSARPSSRTTSAWARRATRTSCARSRTITAEETRATGPQWTFSPVHLRRARRPLGPHVRELQRGPAASSRRWRPRSTATRARAASSRTATACSPPPSTTRATATRSTAPATGDYKIDQGITVTNRQRLLGHVAAPVRARRAEAPRRQRDAVLLERRLDRGRRRQPVSTCTRNRELITDVLKGKMRLRRLRDQRLGGHPPDHRRPPTWRDPGHAPASTPAST